MVGVWDMILISEIDEIVINNNLKLRYNNNEIYTYSGSILISVNPYKQLDIFNKEFMQKYHKKKFGTFEPHVFALAEAGYRSIVEERYNQSYVISGESGAGKTESTKLILQYLCEVTSNISAWVQQQILEANTILESFGNAKTVRNDNSSRFGKFMQICFDGNHCIKGCVIQDYLLEQSRITFQSSGERNYHILYQLVSHGQKNDKIMKSLHLRSPKFYKYLNASENVDIAIDEEAKKFEALKMAFTVLEIPQKLIDGVLKVLSTILWLGNLDFIDLDGETCDLSETDKEIQYIIANLLGIDTNNVVNVLLKRQINVRGNITEIPLKINEARENRHAMAKALYSRTFNWLITKINNCTNPGTDEVRFLGVLDIFGFENFSKNSFEQLCINYTNEKLHRFFNHYVFALEQDIYKQEDIRYNHIQFIDNSLCLELIEKPPRCIFKLLAEQCHLPKGSDSAYLNNMHIEFEYNPYYIKSTDRRHWETEFGIKHYAGSVIYSIDGFVEKNRDTQQDVLFDLMSHSHDCFVEELSKLKDSHSQTPSTIPRGTGKTKYTVSDNFRQQLQALIDVLQSSKPWYVRCIKPNTKKIPNTYDDLLVLDQLKYLGMLDIVRIRREGYPIHLKYKDFILKYECLIQKRLCSNYEEDIRVILNELNVLKDDWQIGKSKVFLKSKAYELLEDIRNQLTFSKAIIIQKNWRCYICWTNFKKLRNAALKIQHAYRGWKLRIIFLRTRRAAIIIQSRLRGMFAREVAGALREMRRVDEEMKKRERKVVPIVSAKEKTDTEDLDDCERVVQDEINTLARMAEKIHCHFNAQNDDSLITESNANQDTQKIGCESVDLDNLFAFLSESTPNVTLNTLFDDLSVKMDDLVHDLNKEIEICCQEKKDSKTTIEVSNENKINVNSLLPDSQKVSGTSEPNIDNSIEKNSTKMKNKITTPEPIYEPVFHSDVGNSTSLTKNSFCHNSSSDNVLKGNDMDIYINVQKQVSPTKLNNYDTVRNQDKCNDREERKKHRVEKKLQELHHIGKEFQKDLFNNEIFYDLLEFAENYFNTHERSSEGNLIATLTRKGKKSVELVPKYEMINFCRLDKISTSHIHLHDPENVNLACNIYKELWKYMRGEILPERELQIIQYIIGMGIEREELRDEIFVQCMRQTTNNPNSEWTDRIWLLMCLAIVAFQPSKLLFRYFVSYLKKNLQTLDGKFKQYAHWCFDNCKCSKVSTRQYPPSSVEVAAMRRLGTIVCRFFFLDGRTKAIDVHPTDTAAEAVQKLADKLNLISIDGWAIYQSRTDGEQHIKNFDYLYDIIAAWELKQMTGSNNIKGNTIGIPVGENRFVFKKRLFKSIKELSQDPVEVNMLYAQAVYSVVKCDDFPVSEKVALQLAGLQAQVALGNPSNQPRPEYYSDVDSFLPKRISCTREQKFWIPIIAQAHRQYGSSRNEITAKVLYLSCVMQYPLYGTTMFNVCYKGYWTLANNIILGINHEGIIFIQPEDKTILHQLRYNDIESILIDPSDSFLTISLNSDAIFQAQLNKQLRNTSSGVECQKCFVFETVEKNEIGSLIVSYYPALSNWISNYQETLKGCKSITSEDRARLYQNVIICRRQLIDMDFVRKPQETGGFIRNTLRRLSKQRLEKLRAEQRSCLQDHNENYKGFPHTFWAFTKQPFLFSISKLSDQEELTMVQIFSSILTYSGLATSDKSVKRAEDEHITIIQSIIDKCMRKDCLLNELYLQLIKQTTDHPDPNSRVNLRNWALLSVVCSVILPSVKAVRKYLMTHLRRSSSDFITEEGKYARFAEKCFSKTQGKKRRQWSPSRAEILCTTNRRPCYARFYFMDSQYFSIEFEPSSEVFEIMHTIKEKIGLNENALGYALYEVLGNSERSLMQEEKICDIMAKWEKYQNASQKAIHNQVHSNSFCHNQQHIFLFKKHLFCDEYMNLEDPIEKELLYHQTLYNLRTERFPITEMEAIMLTALQAQLELGDCSENVIDYRLIASHCLPPRFVPNIPNEAVTMHHHSLRGMLPAEAKKSFLNLIQSWPLHRATIFDVMQTFTSNWPRLLWLAIDQSGIHILEHRSRNILRTHDYESIISYSPNTSSLMIFTGTTKKQSKVVLSTSQAFQISTLIKEYSDIIASKKTFSF